MAFSLPHLGPRTRKVVRYAGFVVVGLVTFVFGLQMSLPYERLGDRAISAAAEKGYDLTIGEIDPGWIPGRVYFKKVTLVSRTTKPDEVPLRLSVDKIRVDVGIFALAGQTLSIDIDATIKGGRITGNISRPLSGGAGNYSVHLDGKDLPSKLLPMRDIVGLPTTGDINLSVDASVPVEENKQGRLAMNWDKLEGDIGFSCPSNCVYGDGQTKLKMKIKNQRNAEFAKDGIDFGTLNIDSLDARLEAKSGKLEVTKFDAKSSDGELHVDFTMDLQPELNESLVAGCLRYKGSDALLKRDQKSFNAITLIGGALGPDKLFHVKLSEKWRDIRKVGQVCGSAASGNIDEAPGSGTGTNPRRPPHLQVQPEPGSATPPPAPPPMPPIPPAMQPTPTVTPGAAGSAGSAGSAVKPEGEGSGSGEPAPGSGTPNAGAATGP